MRAGFEILDREPRHPPRRGGPRLPRGRRPLLRRGAQPLLGRAGRVRRRRSDRGKARRVVAAATDWALRNGGLEQAIRFDVVAVTFEEAAAAAYRGAFDGEGSRGWLTGTGERGEGRSRARSTWWRRRSATSATSRRGRRGPPVRAGGGRRGHAPDAEALFAHLGAPAPVLVSLPAFDERGRVAALVARLLAGESVALCTDAGTPGVSDPGAALVAAAWEAGARVVPSPDRAPRSRRSPRRGSPPTASCSPGSCREGRRRRGARVLAATPATPPSSTRPGTGRARRSSTSPGARRS